MTSRTVQDVMTFIALQMLLGLTVAVSYWNLKPSLLLWGLAIATVKGALIVLIFMRLRTSGKVVVLYPVLAGTGLAILYLLVLNDFFTR